MRIDDEQIQKFQQLCKDHFSQDITREQALEYGTQLVNLMKLIYKPIRESDLKKYN